MLFLHWTSPCTKRLPFPSFQYQKLFHLVHLCSKPFLAPALTTSTKSSPRYLMHFGISILYLWSSFGYCRFYNSFHQFAFEILLWCQSYRYLLFLTIAVIHQFWKHHEFHSYCRQVALHFIHFWLSGISGSILGYNPSYSL